MKYIKIFFLIGIFFWDLTPAFPMSSEDDTPKTISKPGPHNSLDNQPQREGDLKQIKKASILIGILETVIQKKMGFNSFSEHLTALGKTLKTLSWNQMDPENIRNKHGYRNRYDKKGNIKNSLGAKIDFESLQHLTLLSTEWLELLYANPQIVCQSLLILKEKLDFLLSFEADKKTASQHSSHDKFPGILLQVSAYIHDRECLKSIKAYLEELVSENFRTLDYTHASHRYCLGYVFVQMGETAKELSDFIKIELFKDGRKNVLRYLFGRLATYRQTIKDKPRLVIKNSPFLISTYNRVLLYSKEIFQIISSLETSLSQLLPLEGDETPLRKLCESYILEKDGLGHQFSLAQSNLSRVAAGLHISEDKSEEDIQKEITEKEEKRKDLETQEKAISVRLSTLQSDRKGETDTASNSPRAVLEAFYKNVLSTKNMKQFLKLYALFKNEGLAGDIDPLANPEEFVKEINSLSEKEQFKTRIEILKKKLEPKAAGEKAVDPQKQFQALIRLLDKIKLKRIKDTAKKVSQDSQVVLHLDDILALVAFLEKQLGSSEEAAHGSASIELAQEHRKIKKALDYLTRQIESQKDNLEALIDLREKQRAMSSQVVVPSQKLSSTKSEILSLVQRDINDVLSVYRMLSTLDSEETPDFVVHRASAMALGFLGEYYKKFMEKDELSIAFVERSPMLGSMVAAKNTRNQEIMHNSKSYSTYRALQMVRTDVAPWVTDMHFLRDLCASQDLNMELFLNVQPSEKQKKINELNYSDNEQKVFLINVHMSSLLRFIKPQTAINFAGQHESLLSDPLVSFKLFFKNRILLAKAYSMLGNETSFNTALTILQNLENDLDKVTSTAKRKKYKETIILKKALLLAQQRNFSTSRDILSELLQDVDSKREDEVLELFADLKAISDHRTGVKPFIQFLNDHLNSATLQNVLKYAQMLSVYCIAHGNYHRAGVIVNFMERKLQENDTALKNTMGQFFEFLQGSVFYARALLLYHEGVSTENMELVRRSADKYARHLDILQRIQLDAELPKRMQYRLGRSLLFSEKDPDKARKQFENSGVVRDDEDIVNDEYEKLLIRGILKNAFAYYVLNFMSFKIVQDYDEELASRITSYKDCDLLDEILDITFHLRNYYNNAANIPIAKNDWNKAKYFLSLSCLSSHIVRFVERIYLDISTTIDPDSEENFQKVLEASISLFELSPKNLFQKVSDFCKERAKHFYISRQFFPERYMSSSADVVSLYFEDIEEDSEEKTIKDATSALMTLYARMMPPKGHLQRIGGSKTDNLFSRMSNKSSDRDDIKDLDKLIRSIHDIIELRRPSSWSAFWYLTQPEIQISTRLEDPFRKCGLICGAKFLSAVNAGLLTETSTSEDLEELLLNDEYERDILSDTNPLFREVAYSDLASLFDHFKYVNRTVMFDPRLLIFSIPPHKSQKYETNEDVINQSRELFNQRKYNKAIKVLRKHLTRYQNDGFGMYLLGYFYYCIDNIKKAKRWVRSSADLGCEQAKEFLERI